MWVNRKLLGEMLGRWHTEAAEHVRLAVDDMDRARMDAKAREDRCNDQIDAAKDERESLIEAFQLQEHTLNRLIDDLKREAAILRSGNAELKRQLTVAQNNFEWARVRLNAVEQERALLIERVLAVRFPVPVFTREVGPAEMPQAEQAKAEDDTSSLLKGLGLPLNIFEDVGDSEAAAAGLTHEDDGTVVTK